NMFKTVSVEISKDEERLIYAMQLLGDKTRFKIFKLLLNQDEMCVTDIAHQLGISVSAVSQHFRNFELVGLVDKERMGQKICYILKTEDSLVKELLLVVNKKSNLGD
ncbi:MAG: metalloregulator ArsR/SmtB family transcription factor, partial [Candidatus Saccharibacteria bacterium]